jgi:hypothetical protein
MSSEMECDALELIQIIGYNYSPLSTKQCWKFKLILSQNTMTKIKTLYPFFESTTITLQVPNKLCKYFEYDDDLVQPSHTNKHRFIIPFVEIFYDYFIRVFEVGQLYVSTKLCIIQDKHSNRLIFTWSEFNNDL